MPVDNTERLAEAARNRHELARSKTIRTLREMEVERAGAVEAREALAGVRGRLAVLQEQADRYWNKKDAQPGRKTGK